MDELYLEVTSRPVSGVVHAPLETVIALVNLKYCDHSPSSLIFVLKSGIEPSYEIKITNFAYELVTENKICDVARMCKLPAVVVGDNTAVAGLCAVLRQIIKSTVKNCSDHRCSSLLGFRQGCLMACAESSVWTRFCEVDIIKSVNELVLQDNFTSVVTIPDDVARFEIHMGQPLHIHNIKKRNQDYIKSKENASEKSRKELHNLTVGKDASANGTAGIEIDHIFAEGPSMTLADMMIFPCIRIILQSIHNVFLQPYIPLITQWYDRMKMQDGVEESVSIVGNVPHKISDDLYVKHIFPDVPKKSLYKSVPKRYKPRSCLFTRQEDVETSLKVVDDLGIEIEWQQYPFGFEVEFDWSSVPYEAHPKGGQLPDVRLERKCQQLENLAKAVLKVVKPGHTIVDFCSGSGHLGIVLAHFLPHCEVILLENKEESLNRARERVSKLKLTNVTFYQCNLDYFCGSFDIGVSLHACSVATDLVIQQCINRNAVFVCCPCCYGAVQNNHILTYPRSKFFRDALTLREYLVLGHSADQTHDELNAKTHQGNICMGIIDTDRCLQAKESGYSVSLSKLLPESCTPKNNLLVGLPKNWK